MATRQLNPLIQCRHVGIRKIFCHQYFQSPVDHQIGRRLLSAVQTNELHLALTAFFGLDFARTENEKADLESREVKQYGLKQPKQVFDYLMTDAGYAKDALRLLKESGNSKVLRLLELLF